MKVQEFINLGKGINDDTDFDPDFLTDLYASVEKEPLGLHQSEFRKRVNYEAINSNSSKKQEIFQKQRQEMLSSFN